MLIPTPRLLLVVLAGIIPMVLGDSYQTALAIAGLWLLLAVTLAWIDSRFVPPASKLVWSRKYQPRLSLGVANSLILKLHNRSDRAVIIRVRDALPPQLINREEPIEGTCGAHSEWHVELSIVPVHRGDYDLGPLTARYLGPMGLVWLQRRAPLHDRVQVYPNLLAVRDYTALAQLRHLQQAGVRASGRRGTGTEFERLRDYTPDDEFRRINWPATARLHRPIAVDYQTEQNQTVMIVLDGGRRMAASVPSTDESNPPLSRLDYAVNASLLLAFVSQQHGDRVGLMSFSDHVIRYAAARAGRGHFLTLMEALYNLESEPVEADYAGALDYFAVRNPRRSLVLIFTDLVEPEATAALASRAIHLARRHLPLVVTLRDPEIERLAMEEPLDSKRVYERAVAQSLLDDRAETLARLRRHGVLTLDVAADALSTSVINRYIEIKERSRL